MIASPNSKSVINQKTEDMIQTPHLLKRVQILSCLLKTKLIRSLDLIILNHTVTGWTVKSSSTFFLRLMYTAILACPKTKFKCWYLCFWWLVYLKPSIKNCLIKKNPHTFKKQLLEIRTMLTYAGFYKNCEKKSPYGHRKDTCLPPFHWWLTQKSWLQRCYGGLSSEGHHVSWRVEACTALSPGACSVQLGPGSFSRACQLVGSVFIVKCFSGGVL